MLQLTIRSLNVSRTAVSITANRWNFLGSVESSVCINSGPRAWVSWAWSSGKSDLSRAGSIAEVGFTDSARARVSWRKAPNEATTALMPSLAEATLDIFVPSMCSQLVVCFLHEILLFPQLLLRRLQQYNRKVSVYFSSFAAAAWTLFVTVEANRRMS